MKKTISVIITLVLLAVFTACNGDTLDLDPDRIEQMLNLPSSLISDDSDDDIGSELDTSTNGTDPADTDDPSNQDQSDPASTANSNTASRPSQNGSTASNNTAQPSNQPNTPPAPPITTPPPAPQPDLPTASPPAAPAPKTAWDYPYDVVAMEAECKAYAESIGLYYMDRESHINEWFITNPDGTYSPNGNKDPYGWSYTSVDEIPEVTKFNGSWFPPDETIKTSLGSTGENLKKRIFKAIYDYRYDETAHFVTKIRVWFEKYEDFVPSGFGEMPPIGGPGDYLVFFLWA